MNLPKAHFLHIGKTGGSAIKHALRPYAHTDLFEICISSGHSPLKLIPLDDAFFFCLRDPLTRFVSAFYSRKRKGRPRLNGPWSALEGEMFSGYATPNQLAEGLCDHYELALRAMKGVWHFQPMVKLCGGLDALKLRSEHLVMVCRQETLTDDFVVLREKLGLPTECQLPLDRVLAHKNPEGIDLHLSARSTEFLLDYYRADYELINYCETLATSRNNRRTS